MHLVQHHGLGGFQTRLDKALSNPLLLTLLWEGGGGEGEARLEAPFILSCSTILCLCPAYLSSP